MNIPPNTNFCIFCPDKFKTAKDEHIILKSLGGSLKTSKFVCSKCNSQFGNTIDEMLSNKYAFMMNLLGPLLKNGIKSPTIRLKRNGEITVLTSGAEPHVEKAKVDLKKGEIIGNDEEHVKKIIKKIKGIDVKKIKIKKDLIKPDGKIYLNTKTTPIIDPGEFRAVAKCLVEYIFFQTGTNLYDQNIIDFINGDLKKGQGRIGWIDYPDVVKLNIFLDKYYTISEFGHSIILSLDSKNKRISGYLLLFSSFGYKLILSNDYCGTDMTFIYQRNILKNSTKDLSCKKNKNLLSHMHIKFAKITDKNDVLIFWKKYRSKIVIKIAKNIELNAKEHKLHNYEKILTKNFSVPLKKQNKLALFLFVWKNIEGRYDTASNAWKKENYKIFHSLKEQIVSEIIKDKNDILEFVWGIHIKINKLLLKYIGAPKDSIMTIESHFSKNNF